MYKFFKISVFVLVMLPILVFLGFVGAVSFIDFNRYKPQIEQEVKALTQRDFKIEGAIEVSVVPFALSLGKSTLSNPENFSNAPVLLSFKELHTEMSLQSLFLEKKLVIQSIEWIEPKVTLVSDSSLQTNWQGLPSLETLMHQFLVETPESAADAQSWVLNSLIIEGGALSL